MTMTFRRPGLSAEVDPNLEARQAEAALMRWCPLQLRDAAATFGKIHSGDVIDGRLRLSFNDVRQRGDHVLRESTTVNSPAVGGRDATPPTLFGLDSYGGTLLQMMNVITVQNDYQRRPVVESTPTVSTYAEGADITSGTVTITNAPPGDNLKPATFATALTWTSQARAGAGMRTWGAFDDAMIEHVKNAIMAAIFSDTKARDWTGLLHADFGIHSAERRNVGDSATRPEVTLADCAALESRVNRTGQRFKPIVWIADTDTFEELSVTPKSAGDGPIRNGDRMYDGNPIHPFDSTWTGREKILICAAMGSIEPIFWETMIDILYVPEQSANKTFVYRSQAILDAVNPDVNIAASYSTT